MSRLNTEEVCETLNSLLSDDLFNALIRSKINVDCSLNFEESEVVCTISHDGDVVTSPFGIINAMCSGTIGLSMHKDENGEFKPSRFVVMGDQE